MFYIHFYLFIQTLTTLHLGYNTIGFEGAQFLANALQNNRVRQDFYVFVILVLIIFLQTLTELILELDDIGNQGAQCLANALENNKVRPFY